MIDIIDAPRKSTSIYQPIIAEVVEVQPLTEMEKLFKIRLPNSKPLDHKPGQFIMISLMGIGEAPISVTSSPSRTGEIFELCIRKSGVLTSALHNLKKGDKVGIRGPYGNGFPIERFHGKDMLLVPGGLGLAPMRSLINQLWAERRKFGRVIILYGARSPSELLFRYELEEWMKRDDVELHITVDHPDEEWTGNVGVITTLIPKVQLYATNTVAVTVGPPVMYKFVLAELLSLGKGLRESDIWLSFERRMKCGLGKCGHCQMNHLYVCQSGPCFSYAQIKNVGEALNV
jgi:sulfite reductase subunit B